MTESTEPTISNDSPAIAPASRLAGTKPYAHPKQSHDIDLWLDLNEGQGPSPAVLRAMTDVSAATIRRYPDASSLEANIAERLGTDPSRVLVTNGGDDAIDRACRAVLEPGRQAILHTPTFEMIPRGARMSGAAVVEISWREGEFPVQLFLDALNDEDQAHTSMIALVTPNNPTGGVIPTDSLLAIADAAPHALVLVDLAYIEFAAEDPTPALIDRPNVMMVRTFSKARGLAGLRIGYAVAHESIITLLRTTGGPYPVSPLSIAAANASLDDDQILSSSINLVRTERDQLTALLTKLGAEPLPSHANFVTAKFNDSEAVRNALAARGIAVRGWPARPDLAGLLRITLPANTVDFDRLKAAFVAILEGTSS